MALTWTIPDTGGAPIADVGVELASDQRADGTAYLDFLTWSGTPDVVLTRPDFVGAPQRRFADGLTSDMWQHGSAAWTASTGGGPRTTASSRTRGERAAHQGTRLDRLCGAADVAPHMAKAAGLAVRVQGMRRYYALLLCDDQKVRLIKALDGDTVLAEQDFAWRFGGTYDLELAVEGNRLRGKVNGELLFDVEDADRPLTGGAVALVCESGTYGHQRRLRSLVCLTRVGGSMQLIDIVRRGCAHPLRPKGKDSVGRPRLQRRMLDGTRPRPNDQPARAHHRPARCLDSRRAAGRAADAHPRSGVRAGFLRKPAGRTRTHGARHRLWSTSIAYAFAAPQEHGLACTAFGTTSARRTSGTGYGLVMLIFGEFNVFRPEEARTILEKAYAALAPGGLVLLEPHTFAMVEQLGRQPASWYKRPHGTQRSCLCLQSVSGMKPRPVATGARY
ncbi:MAG: hypothetical protein R2854_29525 [Caldilineaceae bacterium]